jgi:WD40 repeat protein/serine/threonine protein kinase
MDSDELAGRQEKTEHNPKTPWFSLPDYELINCIGSGAYGEVWLVRTMTGEYRAAKIVFRARFKDERPFLRELSGIRKFEPISRSYEGFVDVLHVGQNAEQKYFYYIMELGDDEETGQRINPDRYSPNTLATEARRRGKLPVDKCIEVGLALTQALAELHKHDLVHRDVKPANIIFVNGVPKLADIGLITRADDAHSYVGTEGFIPDEGPGSQQADVYALGKVLYEASTGKDRLQFPELPTRIDDDPDSRRFVELNEILLLACRGDASERYQSAWEMHAHLLVLANGKSVKRLRQLEQRFTNLKKWAVVSVLITLFISPFVYTAVRERKLGNTLQQQQIGRTVGFGIDAMNSGDMLAAMPHFAEALRLAQGDPVAENEGRVRWASILDHSPILIQALFLHKQAQDIGISPDGNALAIALARSKIVVYDLRSGKLASEFGRTAWQYTASYSPDGRFLITGGSDRVAHVWDTANWKEICQLPHSSVVLSARFSPDGNRVVTACKDGVARVWDTTTGVLLLKLEGHIEAVRFAAFSPNGRLIVTSANDNTARIWNALDGSRIGIPLYHSKWVNCAAFSSDNRRVVTVSADYTVCSWDIQTGSRISRNLNHEDAVESVGISPDGRLLVTSCLDRRIRILQADNLQPFWPCPVLYAGERVIRASFGPDGRSVIAACTDGTVRVWDLSGCMSAPRFGPISFSQDGGRSIVRSNNFIEVRDVFSETLVSPPIKVDSTIERIELSRSGQFMTILSASGTNATNSSRSLRVCDVATAADIGAGINRIPPRTKAILRDDGKRILLLCQGSAKLWNVESGSMGHELILNGAGLAGATFNFDSTRLALMSGTNISVWNGDFDKHLYTVSHPATARAVAFSRNGRYLATCCSDNQDTKCFAQLWSAKTGEPVGSRLNHEDGVLTVAFSPDSRKLVTTSEDHTAIVWEVPTGRQLTRPLKHRNQVRTATFSGDGKWIVTTCDDGSAQVWNAETGDPVTPPLCPAAPPVEAQFLGGSQHVVTRDRVGNTWMWGLQKDTRSIRDLVSIAELLSGGITYPGTGKPPHQSEPAESLWARLRTQYPGDFSAKPEKVALWHDMQAFECESDRQWLSASFHLKQLILMRPGDRVLAGRLARVTAESEAFHQ